MMRSETSAPRTRIVDALTGRKSPERFFKSLSEADDFIRRSDGNATELDRLARDNAKLREQSEALLCRVDELTDENRELKQHNADLWAALQAKAVSA